jgi:hypothetical protein
MKKILRLFLWNYIRTIKHTLLGRNRDRKQPESGRITKEDVDLIIEESLRYYTILKLKAPFEKTLGARLMLRNGIVSLALYRAIGKVAVGEEYVTELCTDILWKFYIKNISIQRFIARFLYREPLQQMNIIQRIFLWFPLAKPGYDWKINEMEEVCAYDITRCPVCDYFKSQGPAELKFFRNSWCTLDFPLAEHLVRGGRYERTHTLSAGDALCDMCWKVI